MYNCNCINKNNFLAPVIVHEKEESTKFLVNFLKS